MNSLGFRVPQSCAHCGKDMMMLVISEPFNRIRVAIVHDEWDTPQWQTVKGMDFGTERLQTGGGDGGTLHEPKRIGA